VREKVKERDGYNRKSQYRKLGYFDEYGTHWNQRTITPAKNKISHKITVLEGDRKFSFPELNIT